MTLKEITNKALDESIDIEQANGTTTTTTKREAFIARLIQDSIFDEDPGTRQKAANMILDLCGWKDEQRQEPSAGGITNKHGKRIGK